MWVRETWLADTHGFHSYWADYLPEEGRTRDGIGVDVLGGIEAGMYWKKPSMFMKRPYSRLLLEITQEGVERVQDISEEDAEAEGLVAHPLHVTRPIIGADYFTTVSARSQFKTLWDNLNKKRGYGWERNVWVWTIGFKLLSKASVV